MSELSTLAQLAQDFAPLWDRLQDKMPEILLATWETLQMVMLSTFFSLLIGAMCRSSSPWTSSNR